ncbi:lecithin retinol acyltransferase family protein [Alkalimarinus coralli]|uniref:lecithin retinol acyltransferase family protein n=1 Tax=Alkalimarinus coralli TaxID=2935863 RepID=UPI00202B4AF7|nr:lecithin retinol acyltransferase family protein [Alkalimarinus coralli]
MNNLELNLPEKEVSEFLTRKYLDQVFQSTVIEDHSLTDQINRHYNLPKIGSHLVTPRLGYTHHGVYVGDEQVIHYSGFGNEMRGGPVEKVSIGEFCDGREYTIQYHNHVQFSPEQIVERAKSKLEESQYNLVFNNCEHFANWCIDNLHISNQVHQVSRAVLPRGTYIVALEQTRISLVGYLKGDINKEKLFEDISHTVINTASMSFYGALGQAAIPIPVAGFLIGSSIGLVVGNLLQQSGLLALGDSPVVQEAKERRHEINQLCQRLIPEIQKSRAQLEEYLSTHFESRAAIFSSAFNSLDESLTTLDTKRFTDSLEQINNQFGTVLEFADFQDFDNFMESDDSFDF